MYIMESQAETQRLVEQERVDEVRQVMLQTGLKPGAHVLDAGCGPGVISELIAEVVGESGQVLGIDQSEERIREASQRCQNRPGLRFLRADVRSTGLADGAFDYTWCQYVFQYLPQRRAALDELIRVTRPGGRVVVSEIDGFGLGNYPFPEALQASCQLFVEGLSRTGFDLFVGRKLFHEFRQAGLLDVRVHVLPQYVVAGAADVRIMEDWRTRFEALAPHVIPVFSSPAAYEVHCRDYLQMLADPNTLKYAVRLVTEGRRA
jgi:ubiquinone/menaquinone biosynthesis C-methylase UbiE